MCLCRVEWPCSGGCSLPFLFICSCESTSSLDTGDFKVFDVAGKLHIGNLAVSGRQATSGSGELLGQSSFEVVIGRLDYNLRLRRGALDHEGISAGREEGKSKELTAELHGDSIGVSLASLEMMDK